MTTINRIGIFFVDETGYLVRRCIPRSGKVYEHRCDLKTLDEVAHTIDELAGAPFTYEQIHSAMNVVPEVNWPFTQVAVAIAFLKERGIIVAVRGRKHIANGDDVNLDALIEYHALREKPTPAIEPAPGTSAG
jgi:hypothetical protein